MWCCDAASFQLLDVWGRLNNGGTLIPFGPRRVKPPWKKNLHTNMKFTVMTHFK